MHSDSTGRQPPSVVIFKVIKQSSQHFIDCLSALGPRVYIHQGPQPLFEPARPDALVRTPLIGVEKAGEHDPDWLLVVGGDSSAQRLAKERMGVERDNQHLPERRRLRAGSDPMRIELGYHGADFQRRSKARDGEGADARELRWVLTETNVCRSAEDVWRHRGG